MANKGLAQWRRARTSGSLKPPAHERPPQVKILELVKSGNSLSQIVEEISGDCAVSPVVVREDLQEFLRNLETCGLIDAGDANRDA
jgi:hypothetical protein